MSRWRTRLLLLLGLAFTTWIFAGAFRSTLSVRRPAAALDAASIPRCVVVVFDGLDYRMTKAAMDAGELPTFSKVANQGALVPLLSETPPESPVALASLQTGVNPGRHGIFDFVTRGKEYRPQNGMVKVERARLALGKVPVRPPQVTSRLAVPTFSDHVWQAGYPILSLRQSLCFPVPKRPGAWMTSGLGTPDIAGSAGFYAIYSDEHGFYAGETEMGGRRIPLKASDRGAVYETYLEGPPDPARGRGEHGEILHARAPLQFRVMDESEDPAVEITLDGEVERVAVASPSNGRSGHFAVSFRLSTIPPHTVYGMVRFQVRSAKPLVVVTEAVNMDPRHAPMPLSSPQDYAGELMNVYGPYETVGWQEQTFQLNDGWQDDEGFLRDLLEDMDISQAQLLGELKRKPESRLVFTTVTATDRAAHCFYRYLDKDHPARQTTTMSLNGNPYMTVLKRADAYLAALLTSLDADDTLLVCSDHGFETWRWSVNLNQWLVNEGYLVLKQQAGSKSLGTFFRDAQPDDAIDWSKTRAYAMGLGQIYVNQAGREEQGIVAARDADVLVSEIEDKLLKMRNPLVPSGSEIPSKPVHAVYRLKELYSGPLVDRAPDVQVGFARGYRVSWQTALLGGMGPSGSTPVIVRNERAWSGDHCSCDPQLVPGVLLTSKPMGDMATGKKAHVRDIAATVMNHFHIDTSDLDGRPLPLLQEQQVLPNR